MGQLLLTGIGLVFTHLDGHSLLGAIDGDVGIKDGDLINAALVGGGVGRAVLVAECHDSAVERVVDGHAVDLFREAQGLAHEGDIVGAQAAEEAAVPLHLVGDLLVRKRFREESGQTRVAFFGRAGGVVGVLNLEGAALVHELCVGSAEVADAGVEDLGDGSNLAFKGLQVARGIATHIAHEDAGSAGCVLLGVDDGLYRGQGQGDGLLDEDILAGLEAGKG